ncbi:helix-turn-helix domain-containing protein [Nostoc sp. FACHB-280]|uniref:AlbA family DNA-binding domain-containing protein n=1 Tax=Nostoc sp. FACHB-280 TaxID=2692839 RepID=UPI00168BB46F|nr:ATP-binding protein [Nostoc sp. FACHB-280]MBD2493695.1 ATP-binding protein [Nostoc sp. FACHB-280]
MIPKNLDDITENDFQVLIDNSVPESRTIEYKRDLPGGSDTDKKEFLADVSSFANASGGDLIYGIEENQGIAIAIQGLEIDNIDQTILGLEQTIRSGLEPRLPYIFIKPIRLSNSKFIVIIRINKSWISPHRVTFKSHDRFYSRGSNGKYSLDVNELRIAFNLSDTNNEKIRRFRESRIANLVAGETPVPFYDEDSPMVMLHLIPFTSMNPSQIYDLSQIDACSKFIIPISSPRHIAKRYNFDGRVDYGVMGQEGETYTYLQVFKNGIVEAVWKQPENREENQKILYGDYIEHELLKSIPNYIDLLKKLDIGLPIFIFLTITGVKNYYMPVNNLYRMVNRVYTIDRDILVIPEVIIDNYDLVVPQLLKPCFDSMWNAAGFQGSPNYNDQGEWKPRNT